MSNDGMVFLIFTDPGEACPVMEWCFKKITDPGEACPMMEWCLKKLQTPEKHVQWWNDVLKNYNSKIGKKTDLSEPDKHKKWARRIFHLWHT